MVGLADLRTVSDVPVEQNVRKSVGKLIGQRRDTELKIWVAHGGKGRKRGEFEEGRSSKVKI